MKRKSLITELKGLEDDSSRIYQNVSDYVAQDFDGTYVLDELETIKRNIYDLWRNLEDKEDLK